jgi:hypothetical protein
VGPPFFRAFRLQGFSIMVGVEACGLRHSLLLGGGGGGGGRKGLSSASASASLCLAPVRTSAWDFAR